MHEKSCGTDCSGKKFPTLVFMANRHSGNKTPVTIRAARNMAIGLRAIAAEFERLAEAMEGLKQADVEAAGLISGMQGLVKVSAYCGNIQDAFCVNKSLEIVADISGAAAALKAHIHRLQKDSLSPVPDDDTELSRTAPGPPGREPDRGSESPPKSPKGKK